MWRREFSPSRFYQNFGNLWKNVKLFCATNIQKHTKTCFLLLLCWLPMRLISRYMWSSQSLDMHFIVAWSCKMTWQKWRTIWPLMMDNSFSLLNPAILTHLLHGRQPWTNMFASKFMWISDVLDVLGFITCFTFTPCACVSVVLQASYESQTR